VKLSPQEVEERTTQEFLRQLNLAGVGANLFPVQPAAQGPAPQAVLPELPRQASAQASAQAPGPQPGRAPRQADGQPAGPAAAAPQAAAPTGVGTDGVGTDVHGSKSEDQVVEPVARRSAQRASRRVAAPPAAAPGASAGTSKNGKNGKNGGTSTPGARVPKGPLKFQPPSPCSSQGSDCDRATGSCSVSPPRLGSVPSVPPRPASRPASPELQWGAAWDGVPESGAENLAALLAHVENANARLREELGYATCTGPPGAAAPLSPAAKRGRQPTSAKKLRALSPRALSPPGRQPAREVSAPEPSRRARGVPRLALSPRPAHVRR